MAQPVVAATSGITYHGRILQPDGSTPVTGLVQFVLQIRSPSSTNCLMYEEHQSQDLTLTQGIFALTINDGSSLNYAPSGLTIDKVFANTGSFTFGSGECTGATTYVPALGDARQLSVTFQAPGMLAAVVMPSLTLNYAPFAIEAEQISGYTAQSLLRVDDSVVGGTSPLNTAQYTELLSLLAGSSSLYSKAPDGTNGTAIYASSSGTISSAAAGDIWLDTSVTGHDVLKINTDSGVQTIPLSSGGFVTSIGATTGGGNPIVIAGTASAPTIGLAAADATHNGYLSKTDYANFAAKASGSLAAGHLFVGNSSGVATDVALSGDATLTSSGAINVSSLQGRALASTAPVDGQTLVYNATATQWQPQNFSIASLRTAAGVSQFTQAACSSSQTLTWSSLTDAFSCTSIELSATAITSGIIPSARLPASATSWGAGGSTLYNTNSGNIGIGTTSPNFKLDVTGQIHATDSISADNGIYAPNIPAAYYLSNPSYTSGTWSRMTRVTMSQIYQSFSAKIAIDGAAGATVAVNAQISLRINQGLALGNPPTVNVEVDSSNSSLLPTDVVAVVTTNTASQTVVDLFCRLNYSYDQWAYVVSGRNGWFDAVDYTAVAPVATLPIGTQFVGGPGLSLWALKANGTDIAYTGGKVGIGTTAPLATLDINGYAKLKANSSAPASCTSANNGAIALTSQSTLCICKGSSTAWVKAIDGSTACAW